MKSTIEKKQAIYLAQQLQKRQMPEGGMLFFKAVIQARLDYTLDSIERLDKMFAQMRSHGITLDKIITRPDHKNFLLTIAFYMGDYIGKQLGEEPVWFSYHNFPQFVDCSEVVPKFPSTLIAQYSQTIYLPFTAIMASLLGEFSHVNNVDSVISDALTKGKVDPLIPIESAKACYLRKIQTGCLIDLKENITYFDDFQHIDFDYSYSSLLEIDSLLERIKVRDNLVPDGVVNQALYEKMIDDDAFKAFVYLVGFYIGQTTARLARNSVRWLDFEELKSIEKEIDFVGAIEYKYTMLLGEADVHYPLIAVTNALFGTRQLDMHNCIGAVHFKKNVLQKSKSDLCSFRYSSPTNLDIEYYSSLPDDWRLALNLAGQLALWHLYNVKDGEKIRPQGLVYCPETQKVNFFDQNSFDVESSPDFECLIEGIDCLNAGKPFGFISCCDSFDLPIGSTSAIQIEMRVYSEPNWRLSLLVPFRPACHPLGFAIFPVTADLNQQGDGVTYSQNNFRIMMQMFYQGMQENEVDYGELWSTYYLHENNLYTPAKCLSDSIEIFNPEDSQIEILPN